MWADVVAWLQSSAGARVLQSAVVPALAILVASIVAGLIGRAAVRSAVARANRDQASVAVAGLVEAARGTAGDGRRRAGRLRTEADVRLRLLPLPGAAAAADWAAARIDELQRTRSDGPADADIDDIRDRLIAWVARPKRAKRIFTRPVAAPRFDEQSQSAAPQQVEPEDGPPVRAGRNAGEMRDAAPDTKEVPAWRRTRSAERLQQERSAARRGSPAGRTGTATVAEPHSSADTPSDGEGQAPQVAARHAAPNDAPGAEVSSAGQDDRGTGARPAPAWLDQYDDDAQVTQNMDLKTPPPVAATSVRDRSPSGEDIVPRT